MLAVSDNAMNLAGMIFFFSIVVIGIWINWDERCRWWHPFACLLIVPVVGAAVYGVLWLIGFTLTWLGAV